MHIRIRSSVFACLALASQISAQTLVSYWNFEGNLSDLAPGGSVPDNGTWVGTPSFSSTSPLGAGLLLDGSNFVTVPASADVNGFIGTYSLTGWFRADQWNSSSQALLSKGSSPNYGVERADSTDSLRFVDGSGNPTGGSVNDGVWHHFAAVSAGGETSQLFIDGELVGTGATAGVADSGGLLGIGNIPGAANRGWKGAIDEIGIFHDELTSLQTKAIYSLGKDTVLSYDLSKVLKLFTLHQAGAGGDPVLIGNRTWVYAASDPGGSSNFVRLGADLSGVMLSSGPSVSAFQSSPNFIAAGGPSTLTWNVDPSFATVSISPSVGDVTGSTNAAGQGSVVVNPTETTTYTITATNAAGSNLRRITVFVGFDPQAVRINEFLARPGDVGELDENGVLQDWIELYNPGITSVNLGSYHLTDDMADLTKWSVPSVTLPGKAYLRIFASGEDRKNNVASLHTNFSLSGSGEYLALTRNATGGGVEIVTQFSPAFPAQVSGISYGYNTTGSQLGFLENPTPRAANGTPFQGFVEDTKFSDSRGFFTASFPLTITTETPGATIRYTTDGSTPTQANGTTYSGPVNITKTTILRAFAFRTNFRSTNVDTQSYFFAEDIRTQYANGAAPPGWPSGSVNGQEFNYGMDPDVTNQVGAAEMIRELTAIPTMSIVTDLPNLIDRSTGIYVNADRHGKTWERPASLELVDPDGSVQEFQIDCGIRIRGGFSRSNGNPKHAFRFFFRDEYGDSNLDYPLFGTEGATSFDKMDLRTAQNYSWSFNNESPSQNTFLREVLGRDLQGQYGTPYTRSRYYHLYLNGVYWGLYMTQERVGSDFGETYFKGKEEDFDTLKSAGNSGSYNTEATDGSLLQGNAANPGSDWAALFFKTRAQRTSPTLARYREMQGLNPDGTRNPALPVLLDVDNLIIYSMMIGYTGNYDGPLSNFIGASNNWYALRNRERDDRGFAYFVHDGEHSMGAGPGRWNNSNVNDRMNTTNGSDQRGNYSKYNPAFVHRDLSESTPEYQLRFADIAHGALFDDGALTPESIHATINERHSIVTQVIDAESARWGDSKQSSPSRRSDWDRAVAELRRIVDRRSDDLLGHLRKANLYPDIAAPVFSTKLRRVTPGTPVFLRNEEGLIYYTTDGTDPRAENGMPAATAVSANGAPIPVALLDGDSTWNYLDDGTLLSASNVVTGHPSYGPTDWKHPAFNSSAWKSGDGPFGFGGVDGLTFDTTVSSANRITTYFRSEFDVVEPGAALSLVASFVRDDGIVVYLNGREALRSNFDPGVVVGPSTGSANASPEGEVLERSLDTSLLVAGRNVLSMELHNSAPNSNDLGVSFDLTMTLANSSTLIAINEPVEIFSRSFDSVTGEWSALSAGVFTPGGAPSGANLLITEVNYHPADLTAAEAGTVGDKNDFEFIEITNISNEALDLGNLAFVKSQTGIAIEGMRFVFPLGTSIAPRSSLIVVADLAAFPVRYPGVDASLIVGEYQGNLSNGGDRIVLQDADGNEIAVFRYGDRAPWPSRADGDGSTLQLLTIVGNPDYANGSNWVASVGNGGTPGVSPSFGFTGDPNRDFDHDGSSAFYEYFAGTSDSSAGSFDQPTAVLVEEAGQRYAGIKFRSSPGAENVGFEVQSSTTLGNDWASGPVIMSQSTLPDGRFEFIYRQAMPLDSAAEVYLRVRVFQQ